MEEACVTNLDEAKMAYVKSLDDSGMVDASLQMMHIACQVSSFRNSATQTPLAHQFHGIQTIHRLRSKGNAFFSMKHDVLLIVKEKDAIHID